MFDLQLARFRLWLARRLIGLAGALLHVGMPGVANRVLDGAGQQHARVRGILRHA